MKAKELVYLQIRHQETRPIPYTINFEGEVDQTLDAHYGDRSWRERLSPAILRIPQPVLWVDESVVPRFTDPYGTVWRTDKRPHYVEAVPLTEPELSKFHFPQWKFFSQTSGAKKRMLSYEHIQTGFLWPRSARSDESLRVETEIWRQDLFLGRIRFPVGDSIRFTQGTPVENAAAVVESFLELASGAGP